MGLSFSVSGRIGCAKNTSRSGDSLKTNPIMQYKQPRLRSKSGLQSNSLPSFSMRCDRSDPAFFCPQQRSERVVQLIHSRKIVVHPVVIFRWKDARIPADQNAADRNVDMAVAGPG